MLVGQSVHEVHFNDILWTFATKSFGQGIGSKKRTFDFGRTQLSVLKNLTADFTSDLCALFTTLGQGLKASVKKLDRRVVPCLTSSSGFLVDGLVWVPNDGCFSAYATEERIQTSPFISFGGASQRALNSSTHWFVNDCLSFAQR